MSFLQSVIPAVNYSNTDIAHLLPKPGIPTLGTVGDSYLRTLTQVFPTVYPFPIDWISPVNVNGTVINTLVPKETSCFIVSINQFTILPRTFIDQSEGTVSWNVAKQVNLDSQAIRIRYIYGDSDMSLLPNSLLSTETTLDDAGSDLLVTKLSFPNMTKYCMIPYLVYNDVCVFIFPERNTVCQNSALYLDTSYFESAYKSSERQLYPIVSR